MPPTPTPACCNRPGVRRGEAAAPVVWHALNAAALVVAAESSRKLRREMGLDMGERLAADRRSHH
jgi:hypothetical protein